jgi:hypothetical protein
MQHSYTATATGVIAGPVDAGAGHTWRNLYIKTLSTAPDAVVALETSPDNTTYTEVARVTGPNWAFARSDHKQRYVHANVISLGTGAHPLSVNITGSPS